MCAGVEPCKTALQSLHFQLAGVEKFLIDSGDFKLAACRGFDMCGHIDNLVGIEIESDHSIV